MLTIEWDVVLFFAVGVLLLYGLGWLLLVPFKSMLWFLGNSLAGCAALLLLQNLGGSWGLAACANPFSAVLTGFLGLPGLALTLILQNLF